MYRKLSKSVNFKLRYTKSNLESCYTVRIISVTAASEQHKLSKSDAAKNVKPVVDFWMSDDDIGVPKMIKIGGCVLKL